MIPVKTSVEDLDKLTSYLLKQIGWVELSKMQKTLGPSSTDDRKIGAMVALGFAERDSLNVRLTDRGKLLASGNAEDALRASLRNFELYKSTLDWIHYGERSTLTATEVGQYWEMSHKDLVGERKGSTLKDGAVCFGRFVEGAKLGKFTLGRGGKETRVEFNLGEVEKVTLSQPTILEGDPSSDRIIEIPEDIPQDNGSTVQNLRDEPKATVRLSASPSVHVNVEIHIAADATAETVKEIFKNMAKYVLDKPIGDDGDF